jgi:hypothetical protein
MNMPYKHTLYTKRKGTLRVSSITTVPWLQQQIKTRPLQK